MNSKKARALRKEVGFHPSDDRQYLQQVRKDSLSRTTVSSRTAVNSPQSSRGKYLAAKRANG